LGVIEARTRITGVGYSVSVGVGSVIAQTNIVSIAHAVAVAVRTRSDCVLCDIGFS
jgi:hypothetical protein